MINCHKGNVMIYYNIYLYQIVIDFCMNTFVTVKQMVETEIKISLQNKLLPGLLSLQQICNYSLLMFCF